MEPEGSLSHLQLPATSPYPEPARFTPDRRILLPEDPFNIILPSTPGSSKCLFPSGFLTKNPVYTSPLPHARYISFFSILSPAQYWVRITDH